MMKSIALPLLNDDFEGPLEVVQVAWFDDKCYPFLIDRKAGWMYPLPERYRLPENAG